MAVHDCVKPVMYNDNGDEDDDDAPLCFKRQPNSSFKQTIKPSSVPSAVAKGENSEFQKNKGASTSKGATEKSTTISCSSRASVPERSKKMSDLTKMRDKVDARRVAEPAKRAENLGDRDDNRLLSHQLNAPSLVVQKNSSVKSEKAVQGSSEAKQLDKITIKHEASDDSDDDKPLTSRFLALSASGKSDSSYTKKELQSSSKLVSPPSFEKMKSNAEMSDDSEDDKPLTARFNSKASGSTINHGRDGKPYALKVMVNGSIKKEESSEQKSQKRPLGDTVNPRDSLSFKKAKVSEASVRAEVKDHVVKKRLEDNDHVPISQRIKKLDSSSKKQTTTKDSLKKMTSSKKIKKTMKKSQFSKTMKVPPGSGGGQKWTTLEHNGVIFPPPYKPHGIKMLYNGQPVDLTPEQEEVATMFAVMKDTEYATKKQFIDNFFSDWRKVLGKSHVIKKFELCDFTPIYDWHLREKEKKKQLSTEEKKALKEEKLKQEEMYMWAVVDGVKEKVGNFRVEPPGLFRGRGEHPKMGKLKKRIRPRDITINIGKGAAVPKCPIPGERWKEVKHDNTVTWLAFWNDPINPKEFKYVFLAASSTLKGQSDKEKYEKARLLKDYIHNIRANYTRDFTSKDPTKRQIAVATYLIDKLALRAGNEKDDDEADTVGCCTLKVENVEMVPPNKLKFDFLGKDSIRYLNTVEVELPVYKAIGDFQTAKKNGGGKKGKGDDLFDLLDTSKLNAHLRELMPGLTAKVFRTYNASITLDEILNRETKDGAVPEKIAVYQHANKEVAIICNHQRSVSKSHETQMSKLNEKIDELKAQRDELKEDLSRAKKGKPPLKDAEGKPKKNLSPEVLVKKIAQVDTKIEKMELNKQLKEDLKTVALGTSKINYLDPRISVAWCKRHEVPIEKIFNKSLLAKFTWAMDVDPSFRF